MSITPEDRKTILARAYPEQHGLDHESGVIWHGRRVHGLAMVGVAALAFISVLAMVALVPLLVPLHYVLRAKGKHGFFHIEDDSFVFHISVKSFRVPPAEPA